MKDPTAPGGEPIEELLLLVLLLDRADRDISRDASRAGTGSPLHGLGLGVLLAHAQAVQLLSHRRRIAELDGASDLHDRTLHDRKMLDRARRRCDGPAFAHGAVHLLRTAEQITHSKALRHLDRPELSNLAVELKDLSELASSVD